MNTKTSNYFIDIATIKKQHWMEVLRRIDDNNRFVEERYAGKVARTVL